MERIERWAGLEKRGEGKSLGRAGREGQDEGGKKGMRSIAVLPGAAMERLTSKARERDKPDGQRMSRRHSKSISFG